MNTAAKRVSFEASRTEYQLIEQIAVRAVDMGKKLGVAYDKQTAVMDIAATHCNGCELDLAKLLAAPTTDFAHDVFGIRRHIDRRTGNLTDCFVPRCAAPERG